MPNIESFPSTLLAQISLRAADGEVRTVSYADAMPTTGARVQGTVVLNAAPAVAGAALSQYVILGWIKLTTGDANVLNTDWAEMRVLTGT